MGDSVPSAANAALGGDRLAGQPVQYGPLDRPEIKAATARAVLDDGACGLRIKAVANLRAVRAVTDAPIIGLIKVDLSGSPVRITLTTADVMALVAAGADIVAFDATARDRPEPLAALVAAIHQAGRLAMADCASVLDGQTARSLGVQSRDAAPGCAPQSAADRWLTQSDRDR